MRMPADQFVGNRLRYIINSKDVSFSHQLRMKDNLQQQVTKFLLEGMQVLSFEGFQHLAGLFNQVGFESIGGLLAVPRAAGGTAQGSHNLDQVSKSRV